MIVVIDLFGDEGESSIVATPDDDESQKAIIVPLAPEPLLIEINNRVKVPECT